MDPKNIVIVGAGGSGREIYGLLRDIQVLNPNLWNFKGFVAEDLPDYNIFSQLREKYLGPPMTLAQNIPESKNWGFVCGLGNSISRKFVETLLQNAGMELVTLVHPSAQIGKNVSIGEGSIISANSILSTNIKIGKSVQINFNCIIAHDVVIGDYATLGQSVNLTGGVTLEENVTVHTKACVLPNITIGEKSTVGAGSVVTKNIPKNVTAYGVPAKIFS
jgi:sugar O-acyltransferase (sialic acid O-acetyltransferase NeuD family)